MILTTLFGGARETRELADGTYMIGRAESCRIRFDAPEVSERHAILTVRDGRAILEDLHSSNGTLVNGEAIDAAAVLDGGMVVQIGTAMMRVSEEGEEEGTGNREQGTEIGDSGLSSSVSRPPSSSTASLTRIIAVPIWTTIPLSRMTAASIASPFTSVPFALWRSSRIALPSLTVRIA